MSSKTQFARVEYANNSWAVSGSGSNLALVSKDVGAPSNTGDIFEISYDEPTNGVFYYEVAVESVGGVLNSDSSSISGPTASAAPDSVSSVSASNSPASVSSVTASSNPASVSSVSAANSPASASSVTASNSPASVSSVSASNSPASVCSVTASNSPASVSSVTPSLITTPSNWSPEDITTKAWYDATSDVQVSGTDITQWDDKSGNGYHLTPKSPSGGTTDHTLVSTGLNNLDVVRHDTDDYYSEPIGSMSGDITFAMLCKVNSAGLAGQDAIFSMSGTAPSFQLQAGVNSQFRAHLTGSSTGLGSDTSNTTNYADAWHIFLLKLDLTNTVGKVFVDGSQSGSNVSFTTSLGAHALRIWANRANSFQPSGDIAEFVVVQDSSTSTQEKIEGYLAHKWGLAANLPSNHTYKSSAPTTGSVPTAPSSVTATIPVSYPYQSFVWSTTSTGPNNEVLDGTWTLDTNPPIGTWGYSNSSQSQYGTIMLDSWGAQWGYYNMYGSGLSAAPDVLITNSAVITDLTTARTNLGDSISNVVT